MEFRIIFTAILVLLCSFVLSISGECKLTKRESERTICVVNCPIGQKACECNANYNICEYRLEIDDIKTFVSYQTNLNMDGVRTREIPGVIFNINNTGFEVPRQPQVSNICNNPVGRFCTLPNFVDGKTYRLITAINGQIPGPTIIVHENQIVSVVVKNNLLSETTSIHWHGMHQFNTGFMDGVSSITQCGIQPGTSFNYLFKAEPSGSFWYHSHTGPQRTNGIFGSLIVKESASAVAIIKNYLQNFGINDYLDMPALHTASIVNWSPVVSLEDFQCLAGGLGFYPTLPIGQVPTGGDISYSSVPTYDTSGSAPQPYFSALINGLGRYSEIPYVNTRLSIFTVVRGNVYRFRLIGAQGVFPFRVSIDNHRLTVVATDGYWIEPIKNVNYIILHSGERYDFLLNATEAEGSNFAFRFETMEARILSGESVPFPSEGHEVQAILHYNISSSTGSNEIPSTMYESIINNSIPWNCSQLQNCIAVNCPFLNFHPSYGINCTNVIDFNLLLNTKTAELPDPTPGNCNSSGTIDNECTFYLNFNFESTLGAASINGRAQVLPPSPPQTQPVDFYSEANVCENLAGTCNSYDECQCTHVLDLPFNKTIHFVITNVGTSFEGHPVHMHGHTYFVLHMGYPSYFPENGTIKAPNPDIVCENRNNQTDLNSQPCTVPRWANGVSPVMYNVTRKTPRKDTLMVPPGGYMVLAIRSDNPGWWYMHCHIEPHNVEGMALVLNEAENNRNSNPTGAERCGNFIPGRPEFFDTLILFDPNNPSANIITSPSPSDSIVGSVGSFLSVIAAVASLFLIVF